MTAAAWEQPVDENLNVDDAVTTVERTAVKQVQNTLWVAWSEPQGANIQARAAYLTAGAPPDWVEAGGVGAQPININAAGHAGKVSLADLNDEAYLAWE